MDSTLVNPPPTSLDENKIKLILEVWKTDLEVQQHFNMIEMQIRNIAVTLLTAVVGAAVIGSARLSDVLSTAPVAGDTAASQIPIQAAGYHITPASMILFGGLIAWFACYFMDRHWYHRLLQGSVSHSMYIEKQLENVFPYVSSSNTIKQISPFKLFGKVIHSETKMDIFYFSIGIVLLILIFFVFS
jgi:hypothetical protein